MKKKIDDRLSLYFHSLYPYKASQKSNKRNKAYLGIGGNISNVQRRFKKLFISLKDDGRFSIEQTSPILKNPPFGYLLQEDFYNAIIVCKTNLSAMQTLKVMQRYEKRFKRVRSFQDAPRTLDIDILYFNNEKNKSKVLTLPHPGAKIRQSVTIPMDYLKN
ncbi:MAG: 2-amino-4-hydroxy-6-hydroxymethyldihydropteridine diphosphokinase [Campylobacterales bacterium]|nr:2-amino-4-hydroxy-6-hydroxymethyldihydropteridine diphosphokinase [Campylobacterales bacterium]